MSPLASQASVYLTPQEMTPTNWLAKARGYPGSLASQCKYGDRMDGNQGILSPPTSIPSKHGQLGAHGQPFSGLGGKSGEVISTHTPNIHLAAWLLISNLLLILQTIHYPLSIWQTWTWPRSKLTDEIQVRRSGRKKRKYKRWARRFFNL